MMGLRRSCVAACLILAGLAAARFSAVAASTDLEVTYIDRVPKYTSYAGAVQYSEGTFPDDYLPYFATFAYGLSGQTSATKRWPDDGETVTFTAHVYNRGDTTVSSFTYEWRLDDAVINSGTYSTSMPAGSFATFSQTWAWHWGPHRIKFAITGPGDDRAQNDFIEDYTNGLAFFTFIDFGFAQHFKEQTANWPNAATDSISEWLQRHRIRENQMFEDAGSNCRWRYDRLDYLEDGSPDPPYEGTNYDGAFPGRYHASETGDLRGSGYYSATEDIDYGLLHELGHQLGLIDLYQLDVGAGGNHVNGLGRMGPQGLMHSCAPFFSEHSAKAMNLWYGKRRGYFGQYQFSIPTTNKVRLLSADGDPLVGATVKIYERIQYEGEGQIPNVIKFQGTTNANGIYTIPNASLAYKSYFWADTGDVLHNNPFGYIWCIGQNNVLLIRVEKWGAADYAWLDVTECNIAYWNGNTSTATYTRQMALGREMQYAPPTDLTELNAADWSGYSEEGTTTTWDDTSNKRVGAGSVVMDTTGGYDTAIIYPRGIVGHWDLSAVTHLKVRFYSNNTHGFQNCSPWIRVCDYDNNYIQLQPNHEILDDECHLTWHSYSIPLATGDSTWTRTVQGTPDMTDMNYIEIHADTWDHGFQLWVDGLCFYPQPVPRDTDADGLPDEWEMGFLETLAYDGDDDPDNDGLINSDELALKTDPSLADTDGDGIEDGEEVALGFDPTDKTSGFILLSVARSSTNPAWFEITWHADENADVTVSWTSGRPGSSRTWDEVDGDALADKVYNGSSTWTWTDKGTDPDMGGQAPGSVPMRYYRLSQD
jgi:hypothetical protein